MINIEKYVENKIELLTNKFKSIEKPMLYIFTDEQSGATASYKKSKINLGKKLGVEVVVMTIDNVEDMKHYLELVEIKKAGCILQLPFQNKNVVDFYMNYKSKRDVDGFFKIEELFYKDYSISPCTPKGIYNYLIENYDNLRGKYAVLMGKGNLTNKPLSLMLLNHGITTSIIDSKTDEQIKKDMLSKADIVVCSTGYKGSVKTSDLSSDKEVIVFNCGIVFDENGKLDTELLIDENKDNIKYTPRIKGVGILTTYNLFDNLYNLLSGDK